MENNMVIKTLLDEQKSKANKLSDGEAIILLDDILKRQGREDMERLFDNDMQHIKKRIVNETFDLSGCKNINEDLAKELIAQVQREHITNNGITNIDKTPTIRKRL